MDTFGERFGLLIKDKRGFEGLTQQQLALDAFGDENYKTRISELENGRVARPQQKTVDALVVALNITPEELVECRKPPLNIENDMQRMSAVSDGPQADVVTQIRNSKRLNWLGFGAVGFSVILIGFIAVGRLFQNERPIVPPEDPTLIQETENTTSPESIKEANIYKSECDAGSLNGCRNLGFLYYQGIGVEADRQEAARFYKLACDGGNAEGCEHLGYLYYKGIGVEADPQEAARLYKLACDGGYAEGCVYLGYLYHNGLGVRADPQEAARLFKLACNDDEVLGCANLGYLYQKGLGVEPDPQEAARLYRLACDGGHAEGCRFLRLLR